MAEGTQISTRGRGNRETPTRFRISRIMCSVMSKSVMAPWRSGRMATTWPGVRPIISQASSPMARTSPERVFSAITVGWSNTIPSRGSSMATRVLTILTGVKYSPPRLPSEFANSPMKYL